MEQIVIRYGESLTLPIDTGDSTAVTAEIYIGKPGESYIFTSSIALNDGKGTFIISSVDTQIPLGNYSYQINVLGANGYIEKYPTPDVNCNDCENDFPQFIVCEAIDEIEVS